MFKLSFGWIVAFTVVAGWAIGIAFKKFKHRAVEKKSFLLLMGFLGFVGGLWGLIATMLAKQEFEIFPMWVGAALLINVAFYGPWVFFMRPQGVEAHASIAVSLDIEKRRKDEEVVSAISLGFRRPSGIPYVSVLTIFEGVVKEYIVDVDTLKSRGMIYDGSRRIRFTISIEGIELK
jgi:Ca2+/Na+ antiporter